MLILARIAGQFKTESDESYTECNVRLMDEFNVNVEEMWFISLPKERVRETLIDLNETKCCAIQDVKEKLSAIEQSMNSEFVHLRHDMENLCITLKEIRQKMTYTRQHIHET